MRDPDPDNCLLVSKSSGICVVLCGLFSWVRFNWDDAIGGWIFLGLAALSALAAVAAFLLYAWMVLRL